jgi:hypothetical protein
MYIFLSWITLCCRKGLDPFRWRQGAGLKYTKGHHIFLACTPLLKKKDLIIGIVRAALLDTSTL